MKKAGLFFIGLMLSFSALDAQVKQERDVNSFTKIKVGSAIHLSVSLGVSESLVFEAEQEVLSKLKSEIKNGELHVFLDGSVNNSKEIKAFVTLKSIVGISATGASKVNFTSMVSCDKMEIDANGASYIEIELKAKEINIGSHGASNIKVNGSATLLIATVDGASSLKAMDLKAESVEIKASGAASASVNTSKKLTGAASGASTIRYSGDPKDKNVTVSGSSTIKKT